MDVKLRGLIAEFVERMQGRKFTFVGAVAVQAYGIFKRTLDMDLITNDSSDFESACLSLVGMDFKETKPLGGFAPGFAKWGWQHGRIGADVMFKRLWFRAKVRGKLIEQKITPDEEFWRDIKFRGAEVFGVDIPVPKPVDLAVFKAASSASPCRSPLKAPHDREHVIKLMRRFKISREDLRKRARAMGCLKLVERFLASHEISGSTSSST